MKSLEACRQTIEEKLKSRFSDRRQHPVNLYDPIHYILDLGGKRLRPALCVFTASVFDGDGQAAVLPAMGLEVFHNFTLLHDDLMDDSPLRRGKPTVHERWDANTAILSGDAMSIIANQLVAEAPAPVLKTVLDIFSKTALEVCEGQQFDLDFEDRDDVTEAEYIEMIRLKTSVLIAASLQVGATIGGASPRQAEQLYRFGLNAGIAFQLQDDYLDSFGDAKTFGKRIGGDIISNKKTFLLINALNRAQGATRQQLDRWLAGPVEHHQQKVEAVVRIFRELEVDVLSRKVMVAYHDKALQALGQIGLPDEARAVFEAFAGQVITRQV